MNSEDMLALALKPRAKRKGGLLPETKLQIQCFQYYDQRCRVDPVLRFFTRLYAINPVPGKTMSQAVLSKRMGLRRGVFDAVYMDKRGTPMRQTWLDFKADGGRLTQEQRDWMEWLSDTPINAIECRSLDYFIAIIGG
jgi:hypothetical protein